MYTLKDYYEEAGLETFPPWAGEIVLWDAMKNKPLHPRWAQITGLQLTFSYANGRSGILDDMGTGKTLVGQAWAIWNAWAGTTVACLMPPVLLGQFKHSLTGTFLGIDKYINTQIYHGPGAKRDKLFNDWTIKAPDIILTTYDCFRDERDAFEMFGVKALVLDEARCLAHDDTKTYLSLEKFMGNQGDKFAVAMNGTPARNNLTDLYGLIKFLTPDVYRNREDFDRQHVRYKKVPVKVGTREKAGERQMELIDRYVATDVLWKNLYRQARRVEKKEVMELPPKNIIIKEVDLTGKHKLRYKQFVAERMLEFDDGTMIDGTASASLRSTCMQAVLHPDMFQLTEESAVFEMYDELLEEIDVAHNKVVIFAHYQKTVEKIRDRYKKYQPAVIYGKTSNHEKELKRFLSDPSCRIMVANYVSGGVGLNLQGVCSNVITGEPTSVPGDFQQAVDRVHRGGQEKTVNVFIVIAKSTVYVKTVNDMCKKTAQITSVVSKDKLKAELFGQNEEGNEEVEVVIEDW